MTYFISLHVPVGIVQAMDAYEQQQYKLLTTMTMRGTQGLPQDGGRYACSILLLPTLILVKRVRRSSHQSSSRRISEARPYDRTPPEMR